MSADLNLMQIPPEVLLMILQIHFSHIVGAVARPDDLSSRHKNATDLEIPLANSLRVLLVNSRMSELGTECFHRYATVNINALIVDNSPDYIPRLSEVLHLVPWMILDTSIAPNQWKAAGGCQMPSRKAYF